ncbi:hypothetical protein RO07_20825 [Pandoraea pulmonicola]|uniref:Uncharacterized protein n=1 Tax=Pandoraea pulmonicola TaxID=93221 RepID=A0ABN4EZH1_PANPU|nr:hypothetical protein RO07_20825 [Pandoraea pulmonicola]
MAFANRIHADSEKDRNDGLVSDDDLALWKEEAKIWCAENGGDKHTVSEERCLEILKEAWDLALDPPRPLSVFKDWRQVRKEVEKNMTFSERARIKFTPNGSVGEAAQINAKTTKLYYKQFIDYIEKDIDRFVAAKAIANAESAGISRLEMEYPLGNVRVIRGVQLVTRSEVANTELTRSSESGRPAAYVFQFGGSPLEERYGFIGPDGQLLVFTRENARGSERQKGKFDILLNDSEILHAMGIPFSKNINASHLFCNNGNLKACSIKSFLVDKGGEDGYYSYLSCKSIKEIMEGQIRDGVEHYIKNFKAGNDGSDVIDKILGVVIPFYDQIIGGINDPGHRVDLKDIAFDLFDLGISLTTIGWSGVKIIGTGVAAAKAAIFSGKGIFAALRALKENIKISKFIRISGRELIDFISPPFTGDLLRRMADGVSLPPEGLIQKLNKFDEENMLRPRNFDGADALRCKRGIFGDCIPRLRSTKENEILEGFDYLDHIYKKIDEKFKSPYLTPRGVKDRINKNAEKEIPRVLYRAQPRPGAQPVGAGNYYAEVGFTGPAHATYDDVLAYAIKHTASVGGIKDKAASFSGRRDVAVDFMRDNRDKGYALFKIKRPIGVNQFRRIEYIIKYDGPRLVKEGKITQDELIDAVAQAHISVEEEIFYVANFGKIPQDLVTEVL